MTLGLDMDTDSWYLPLPSIEIRSATLLSLTYLEFST